MRILSNYNYNKSWDQFSGYREAKNHFLSIFLQKTDCKEFGLPGKSLIEKSGRALTHAIAAALYSLPLINSLVLILACIVQNVVYPLESVETAKEQWRQMTDAKKASLGLAYHIAEDQTLTITAEKMQAFLKLLDIEKAKFLCIPLTTLCGEHNLPVDVKGIIIEERNDGSFIAMGIKTYITSRPIHPELGKLLLVTLQKHLPDPTLLELLQSTKTINLVKPHKPRAGTLEAGTTYILSYKDRGQTLHLNVGSFLRNKEEFALWLCHNLLYIKSISCDQEQIIAAKKLIATLLQASPLQPLVATDFPQADLVKGSCEVHLDTTNKGQWVLTHSAKYALKAQNTQLIARRIETVEQTTITYETNKQ